MAGEAWPAGEVHVRACWGALEAELREGAGARADGEAAGGEAAGPRTALFVTWETREGLPRGAAPRLRGCIGILEPRLRLWPALRQYALTAALRDSRFPPVAERELPHLVCTVSLLASFEECGGWEDWERGVHGLIAEFQCPRTGQGHYATYLPEIAEREGWSKRETLESLARKSGFRGSLTPALLQGMRLTRYQSSLCKLTYEQYLAGKGGIAFPRGGGPALAGAGGV